MSRAAEQRNRIKKLERQRAKLESEFGSLVHQRQCLLLHNAILTAWCDALTLVQASSGSWMAPAPRTAATAAAGAGAAAAAAGAAAQQQQDDDEAVREQFHELLREEITLLNELTARDRLGNCPAGAASSALPDPGPNTLSPGDPMAFFRNVSIYQDTRYPDTLFGVVLSAAISSCSAEGGAVAVALLTDPSAHARHTLPCAVLPCAGAACVL
jgi:hypothetical protein